MNTVYHDVEMEPGKLRKVMARRAVLTRRPQFLIESPLTCRFSSVLVASISYERYGEQIAIPGGVPAELFADLPPENWAPVLTLPVLPAGDVIEILFANPLGCPTARFRVWFGETSDLRRMREPSKCKLNEPEEGRHAWRVLASQHSRANQCVFCHSFWIGDPL